MATLDDVREIALSLPDTDETVDGHRGGAVFRTSRGGFVWERGPSKTDLTKLAALGREWPDGTIVAVITDGLDAKEALLETYPDVCFTIPHFNGYAAVLVMLDRIDDELLRELVTDAWLLKAPPGVAKQWLADHGLE